MKLYHGSNVMIDKVDFTKCHPFKDFGCGFYLTDNIKHARNMAFRRCMRTGGEECVTEYEFNFNIASKNLKVKIFDKPSEEWAEFVMMNRDETILHPAHDYDIVIGPIADDSVVISFRLFQDGYISILELVRRLEYKELSIQYFFHNVKAISYLNRVL
ncbi:MAG: DUF3990 domain-containing protein [Muribaculaceae bacterium]|nr:DUF3990 domain-containing protein [Muribaculaceae bacterium]